MSFERSPEKKTEESEEEEVVTAVKEQTTGSIRDLSAI